MQVRFLPRLRPLLAALIVGASFPHLAEGAELRIASLAPTETAFGQLLLSMASEINKATQGEVTLKLFLGGKVGDEQAVQARLGKGIDGAYFTGVGMGLVLPAYRVVELPFLVDTSIEADRINAGVLPSLEKKIAAQGLVLLAPGETGLVYLFSKKPIVDLEALRAAKLGVWKSDQLSLDTWRALGVQTKALELFEMLKALESGEIDAVATTPGGALAFGWSTAVAFVTDRPLANASGGLVLTQAGYDKIPAAQRATVEKIATDYGRRIVEQVRKDNATSMKLLLEKGRLRTVKLSGGQAIEAAARAAWPSLAEGLGAKAELEALSK